MKSITFMILDVPSKIIVIYGIRRRSYGDYLIFYRIDDEQISIVHILHGARDYEALLFHE